MTVAGAIASPPADSIRLQRPLVLGLSIGHPLGTVGTLGPFVVGPNGKAGFVSTSFVLAPKSASPGDRIHQPGPLDVELLTGETRVATLTKVAAPVRNTETQVAAALAELLDAIETRGNVLPPESREAGQRITALAGPDDIVVGDEVAFVGRGSGYSRGRISCVGLTGLNIEQFTFNNVLCAIGESQSFSQPGDGGALVYRCSDCRALGLIFARADMKEGPPESYILPLAPALEALGVRLIS
jgi:hypothetical protein